MAYEICWQQFSNKAGARKLFEKKSVSDVNSEKSCTFQREIRPEF